MAVVRARMSAVGHPREKCEGCQRRFARGECMVAIEDGDGNALGWWCEACVEDWKQNGPKMV